MLTSQIDYNIIADIVRLKESVKQSVEGVMDGSLTAAHLASEVYTLLEHLDKLEVIWRGTPPSEETVPAAAQPQQPVQEPPPVVQPVQEPPPAEQPQPEQPVQEPPAEEQPQAEQPAQEDQQQEEQKTEEV